MPSEIRIVALGAVLRGDDLLVQEDELRSTGETFYRLLGGGVEFGEHSRDAVVREFGEELGVEFANPTLVDTRSSVSTSVGFANSTPSSSANSRTTASRLCSPNSTPPPSSR